MAMFQSVYSNQQSTFRNIIDLFKSINLCDALYNLNS